MTNAPIAETQTATFRTLFHHAIFCLSVIPAGGAAICIRSISAPDCS